MNLRRKITQTLLDWKADPNRVPLVIKGLRQVGKTSSVKAFAIENYANAFFLDFRKQPSLHSIFDGDFLMDDFIKSISALPNENRLIKNSSMVPGKTILIFDEIQDCPNARSSLRYFKEDRRFDVICTGSMLGVDGYRVSKKPMRGIPVAGEEIVEMYSMDFEEFLWASGLDDDVISEIKEKADDKEAIPPYLHTRLLSLVRTYAVVGGMPEVVANFIRTHDIGQARKVQKRILNDYRADFGVHMNDAGELFIDETEKARLLQVFDSIPRQLAKDNQKFQFSVLGHGARSRTHSGALSWLEGYGLIQRCFNLKSLERPLEFFAEEDHFKVYVSDVGLLMGMLEDDTAFEIIIDKLGLGKGFIYENLIADAFHKLGKKTYYYSKDSGLEIDFVATIRGEVCLVEAKAKEGRTKSSRTILSEPSYGIRSVLKLTSQNVSESENIFTAPYYLVFHLLSK